MLGEVRQEVSQPPCALVVVQHPGDGMEESKLLHFFLPVELLFRGLHHRAWTGIILSSGRIERAAIFFGLVQVQRMVWQ